MKFAWDCIIYEIISIKHAEINYNELITQGHVTTIFKMFANTASHTIKI